MVKSGEAVLVLYTSPKIWLGSYEKMEKFCIFYYIDIKWTLTDFTIFFLFRHYVCILAKKLFYLNLDNKYKCKHVHSNPAPLEFSKSCTSIYNNVIAPVDSGFSSIYHVTALLVFLIFHCFCIFSHCARSIFSQGIRFPFVMRKCWRSRSIVAP